MSHVVKQYHSEVLQVLETINETARDRYQVPTHMPEALPEFKPEKWIVFNHLTEIPETFERIKLRGRGRGKGLIIKRKPAIEVTQLPVESASNILTQHDKLTKDHVPADFAEGFSISKAN